MPDLPVIAYRTCTCVNRYCSHHQAIRAMLALIVAKGDAICWRCKQAIKPGQRWDVGHDDVDPKIWRGPEHAAENRATSTRRKPRKSWDL